MPPPARPEEPQHRLSFGVVVGDILQPTHLLFVLVVALLVLGPKRLPEVGKALGRGLRDFRSAMSGEERPESIPPTSDPTPVSAPIQEPAQAATAVQEPAQAATAVPEPAQAAAVVHEPPHAPPAVQEIPPAEPVTPPTEPVQSSESNNGSGVGDAPAPPTDPSESAETARLATNSESDS